MTLTSSSPSHSSGASTTTTGDAGDHIYEVFRDMEESASSSDGASGLQTSKVRPADNSLSIEEGIWDSRGTSVRCTVT